MKQGSAIVCDNILLINILMSSYLPDSAWSGASLGTMTGLPKKSQQRPTCPSALDVFTVFGFYELSRARRRQVIPPQAETGSLPSQLFVKTATFGGFPQRGPRPS